MSSEHRILVVIDHLRGDGTQLALLSLCGRLVDRGARVLVISMRGAGPLAERLQLLGVEVRYAGVARVCSGLVVPWMISIMHTFRPGTVLTLLFVSDVIGLPVARLLGVPNRVSSQRAPLTQYGSSKLALVSFVLKHYPTAVVVNADYLKKQVSSYLGIDASVIRNFIAPMGGCPSETRCPARAPEDVLTIATVARLEPEKGIDIAVKALATMKHKNRVRWTFLGEGSQRQSLETLSRRLGIDDMVNFPGYDHNPRETLRRANLYVQPSRFEGSPNALVEAMAEGCPAIVSDCPGCAELIRHQENGLTFQCGSAESLGKALDWAVEHPDLMESYASRAIETVTVLFDDARVTNDWFRALGMPEGAERKSSSARSMQPT